MLPCWLGCSLLVGLRRWLGSPLRWVLPFLGLLEFLGWMAWKMKARTSPREQPQRHLVRRWFGGSLPWFGFSFFFFKPRTSPRESPRGSDGILSKPRRVQCPSC
jgi:hypothetical protein